jgi:hypothetical protein
MPPGMGVQAFFNPKQSYDMLTLAFIKASGAIHATIEVPNRYPDTQLAIEVRVVCIRGILLANAILSMTF